MTDLSFLFSVVVPTHGRSVFVEGLLVSLHRAIEHARVAVEVVIIDDSPPNERGKIMNLCNEHGARYINGSPSVRDKRNRGIEESQGEIILFTDSDCEVSPNIFEEHLKLYIEADTAAVLGVTEFTGKESITWQIISRTTFLDPFFFAITLREVLESAPYGTCTNLSVRKKVLESIGKFDANFPFRLGGDDTELGVRINKAGYKIKMNPNAVVYHTRETWNGFFKVARRAFRWGRTDFHILRKHPDLGNISFPSFLTVLLLIAIICIAGILTGYLYTAVIAMVGWVASTLLAESILKVIRSREKPQSIFYRLVARLLDLVFELGAIYESLRRGSLSMLYKRIVFTSGQFVIEWENEVIRSWSIIIGLLLTVAIVWGLRGL